jgi:hypothetical protein
MDEHPSALGERGSDSRIKSILIALSPACKSGEVRRLIEFDISVKFEYIRAHRKADRGRPTNSNGTPSGSLTKQIHMSGTGVPESSIVIGARSKTQPAAVDAEGGPVQTGMVRLFDVPTV